MENNLQVFTNSEFGDIRTLNKNGEVWFIGRDIANVLGYSNTNKALADHIDNEDKSAVSIRDRIGREQTATAINESGMYSLILASKLPNAKKFKRWVTHDVLPTLRQQGMYALYEEPTRPQRLFTPEDYLAAARIIANCKSDRLPYILSLLGSGGWELNSIINKKLPPVDTSDISERLKRCILVAGCTIRDISNAVGIDYDVMRSYYYGNRFPKPERYRLIVAAIDNIEQSSKNADAEIKE